MHDPFDFVLNAVESPTSGEKASMQENVPEKGEKAVKAKLGTKNSQSIPPRHDIALENMQETFRRAEAVYKTYQENIRKSQELKAQILIGARKGENLKHLLLLAARCIGYLTGDQTVYAANMKNYLESYSGGQN